MAEGGNAVDAAVCMSFVAAVAEPTETSIGGSGFLLLDDPAEGGPVSVEFPPRAPLSADPALAGVTGPGSRGPLQPCVPGLVAGLGLAHGRYGSLAWDRLLEAAIALAEDGFEVDEYLTLQMLDNLDALRSDRAAEATFLREGLPPVPQFAIRTRSVPGPVVRQPALAGTLRQIAEAGPAVFYRGAVARRIAREVRDRGGLIGIEDLAGYRAALRKPRSMRYRGWRLFAPASPCGASTVMDALRQLERFDRHQPGPPSAATLDRMARALTSAFAARRGDADRTDAGHGTTHLCVADANGRIVSATTTLGETFGAKFALEETGLLLDSGMAWFDARVAGNAIAPGRQPLVNMSPMLLGGSEGRRVGVGAAGGRRIISAITQIVVGLVDRSLSVESALEQPRLDASEEVLRLSDRFPEETFHALRRLGHDVVAVGEEHAPFSYELARPVAVEIDPHGWMRGAIHPPATGYVAGR